MTPKRRMNWPRLILLAFCTSLFIDFIIFPLLYIMNDSQPVPPMLNFVVMLAIGMIVVWHFQGWYTTEVKDDDG